jgi:hypothetical protein
MVYLSGFFLQVMQGVFYHGYNRGECRWSAAGLCRFFAQKKRRKNARGLRPSTPSLMRRVPHLCYQFSFSVTDKSTALFFLLVFHGSSYRRMHGLRAVMRRVFILKTLFGKVF